MKTKKAQFNFVWLFAIIAGAAILILAIYGATKSAETIRFQKETETAKTLDIFTDPLKAGITEGSVGRISFNKETLIRNDCVPGGFGENRISTQTEIKTAGSPAPGAAISIKDKYLFSGDTKAKEFIVFSKPFNFPFKVDDLIFIVSDNYCFINPPEDMADELKALGMPNIQLANCTSDAINVCFTNSEDCDMKVTGTCSSSYCESKFDEGFVSIGSQRTYFVGSLIYGAIFSEKSLYDCNVKRLLYRTSLLSGVLARKAQIQDSRGCNTGTAPLLSYFEELTLNGSAETILSINQAGQALNKKAQGEICNLW